MNILFIINHIKELYCCVKFIMFSSIIIFAFYLFSCLSVTQILFLIIKRLLTAGDDAAHVEFTALSDIVKAVDGNRLAFNHYYQVILGIESLRGFYVQKNVLDKLLVLSDLASFYVFSLKHAINQVIHKKNLSGANFKQFELANLKSYNFKQLEDCASYYDINSRDFKTPCDEDILGCTNAWCLKEGQQFDEPQKAVDVVLILSVFCVKYVLTINRVFAPGNNCKALPGGFVDDGETFVDAAYRELYEECGKKLGVMMSVLYLFTKTGLISPYVTTTHDPRPKFLAGMELGGIGVHIDLDMAGYFIVTLFSIVVTLLFGM